MKKIFIILCFLIPLKSVSQSVYDIDSIEISYCEFILFNSYTPYILFYIEYENKIIKFGMINNIMTYLEINNWEISNYKEEDFKIYKKIHFNLERYK